jgi:AraC-like DNA-binding protein
VTTAGEVIDEIVRGPLEAAFRNAVREQSLETVGGLSERASSAQGLPTDLGPVVVRETPESEKSATAARVRELHEAHPDWSQKRIATEVGCSASLVSRILAKGRSS